MKKIFPILILLFFFSLSLALSPKEERALLEKELEELEQKISQYQQEIEETQREKRTLQNQIYLLKKRIKKLDTEIYQGKLMIKDLKLQIEDTKKSIEKTSQEIEQSRQRLIKLLRLIDEKDKLSIIEIFLIEENLSDFFDSLMALQALSSKTLELLKNIKTLKISLEDQKVALDEEKEDLQRMLQIQALKREAHQKEKQKKDELLQKTKGQEKLYQQLLKTHQERAAEIRARIFELIGIPKAPTFGQAYQLAKFVESITGIRPAFLLAVLTQESNLGKNVGQCNCPPGPYCKHPEISWKEVMKKNRDWEPFLKICQELGRDPDQTPVSCPMYRKGKRIGYGGAMGPAQFLPSTWMRYKSKIEQITGEKPADPWNIRDAFLAAALYLKDYGAASQKYKDEWRAALIYFAGGIKYKFRFYADSVMSLAKQYEKDIETMGR